MLAYLRHQLPILGSLGLGVRLQSFRSNSSAPTPSNEIESTVIRGGGIIGLSTAYFLALDTRADKVDRKADIVVVDPSTKICAGASGQNEG